ncbi:hypothetical protein [Glutamicibacter soli]|uniref:hypothetical protein n=1 Tax=Glutamicibacter soli TaxID=453836 RepID=UPI003FD03D73
MSGRRLRSPCPTRRALNTYTLNECYQRTLEAGANSIKVTRKREYQMLTDTQDDSVLNLQSSGFLV